MTGNLLQIFGRLDWLRFGIRNRIIRFMHHPDTCKSESFTVPFFWGGTYTGNFDTYIDWHVFYYGAYTKEELRLIDDFLRTIEDPIFLDVGANVGHHSLFAAMRAKQVISFEPFLDVAKKLEQKVAENNLSNVSLFKCALGEKNETATYVKPKGHNTGTGSFVNDKTNSDTLELQVRVGDEILAENGVNDVHFIKIDTEGFEPFVLKGLKNTLKRCRPLVFFEWTQGERKLVNQEYFQSLFPENYLIFHFVPDRPFLVFFRMPKYKLVPLSEMWPDGNLFAVPKEYMGSILATNASSSAANQLRYDSPD